MNGKVIGIKMQKYSFTEYSLGEYYMIVCVGQIRSQ